MPVITKTIHGVRWLEWGPEVFDQARREDKLILRDRRGVFAHYRQDGKLRGVGLRLSRQDVPEAG